MVDGDQREGAKAPEDECVRDAGQRPLSDDFPLQHHFPEKLPDARAEAAQARNRWWAREPRMVIEHRLRSRSQKSARETAKSAITSARVPATMASVMR